MKHYKDKECERQQQLIENSNIFNGTTGIACLNHLFYS